MKNRGLCRYQRKRVKRGERDASKTIRTPRICEKKDEIDGVLVSFQKNKEPMSRDPCAQVHLYSTGDYSELLLDTSRGYKKKTSKS